jgi:myo-inositol-1(or 4)-monophosphatase
MADPRFQKERAIVAETVRQAGAAMMQLASHGFETQIKADRSPVTSADLAVNRILHERLSREFPEYGWLSEETPDRPDRLQRKRVWVLDPIDGTAYFIKGIPQFAISIALSEDGQVVVGVVFNPATDQFFSAMRGNGASLNGVSIRTRHPAGARPTLLVSPPSFRRGRFTALTAEAEIRPMGSIAYTLGLVAAGEADGTFNVDRLSEWDIAAGVLLVEEAGGIVTDSTGAAIRFNRPDPSVRGLLAGSAVLHPTLHGLASRVPHH